MYFSCSAVPFAKSKNIHAVMNVFQIFFNVTKFVNFLESVSTFAKLDYNGRYLDFYNIKIIEDFSEPTHKCKYSLFSGSSCEVMKISLPILIRLGKEIKKN